uniref:Uncharacterized protein n=1 Tax=Siphoviridae sp. ctiMP24 TaxID=2825621 RepID=A0A8S5NZA1_9CAUD|nr:MAG TPA: hypothetical protein [Siphoviridae sp. ctiMP24]
MLALPFFLSFFNFCDYNHYTTQIAKRQDEMLPKFFETFWLK